MAVPSRSALPTGQFAFDERLPAGPRSPRKSAVKPGNSILVEDPTYLGAIQAFNAYQARYLTVPMDDQGMRIAELEKTLRQRRTKFAYLVPTFQNPSGITMSLNGAGLFSERPEESLLVIEDDPIVPALFRKGRPVTLRACARPWRRIFIHVFENLISGIRLGFVVAETSVIQALVLAKQAADLQPNTLIQRAVYHYCRRGFLDRHIPHIIEAYRHKATSMLETMERYFLIPWSGRDPKVGCLSGVA